MSSRYENYTLHGVSVWAMPSDIAGGNAALAPDHHIKDGDLDFPACFCSDSYAHLYGTQIKRYGKVIGTVDDLIPVKVEVAS